MGSKCTSDFVRLKLKVKQPVWSEGQRFSAFSGKFPFKLIANTVGRKRERISFPHDMKCLCMVLHLKSFILLFPFFFAA